MLVSKTISFSEGWKKDIDFSFLLSLKEGLLFTIFGIIWCNWNSGIKAWIVLVGNTILSLDSSIVFLAASSRVLPTVSCKFDSATKVWMFIFSLKIFLPLFELEILLGKTIFWRLDKISRLSMSISNSGSSISSFDFSFKLVSSRSTVFIFTLSLFCGLE